MTIRTVIFFSVSIFRYSKAILNESHLLDNDIYNCTEVPLHRLASQGKYGMDDQKHSYRYRYNLRRPLLLHPFS